MTNEISDNKSNNYRVATKAISLTRVNLSQNEDKNQFEAQNKTIREYCKRKNLEIIDQLNVKGSGVKTDDILPISEIEKHVANSTSTIAIVCQSVDRLQRSFTTTVALEKYIKERSIEIRFIDEELVINQKSSQTSKMRWDIATLFAKNYVESLRKNINLSKSNITNN